MIDTVVLQVDLLKSDIRIREDSYSMWVPSPKNILSPPFDDFSGRKKFVNNPTKRDVSNWGYLPRLTLHVDTRGGDLRKTLYIEFSAPKLVFQNNFSELNDSDFDTLCDKLYKKLYQRGVYVPSAKYLGGCDIKTIHYCKNIVYMDGTPPSSMIRLMHKSNISMHKNTNESKYKNGGESCNFYTLDGCFCVYDKRKEFERSKLSKRGRIEEYDNAPQMRLFDDIEVREPFQVLRLEQRFEGKKSIKRNLVKTGIISPNPTFRDLYKSTISKQILMSKVHEIDSNIPVIAKYGKDITSFVECLNILNPKASLTLKLKAIAAKAILNETGTREFRKMIGATDKQWFDLMTGLSEINMPTKSFLDFEEIYKQLEAFEPIKLEDYLDKMSEVDI